MTEPTAGTSEPARLLQVGPGGELAADSQFGVALTTLWHDVSVAGGAVGFTSEVERSAIAAAAARLVGRLQAGTAIGLALIEQRELVGFGLLTPGTGITAHTGELTHVMVAPGRQGSGYGRLLMQGLIDLAAERQITALALTVRDGHGLADFYGQFGFAETGRRPGWLRISADDVRDEVLLVAGS